jgi:hypothetical protein
MSSVVISGDTSGSVTLQAPAVSGTTVLTLPATSGTVLTTASGTAATATNLAGGSNGTIPYQSAAGTTQMLAVGSSGQSLLSGGVGAPTWGTPALATTATTATTATNLASGSAGTIPYQSSAGTTAMSAVGTNGQVLTSSGAGAPSWTTPSSGAMQFISAISPTGQTDVTFTTGISSTYKIYKLYVSLWGTGNATWYPRLRFYANGAADTNAVYSRTYLSNEFSFTRNLSQTAAFFLPTNLGQNQTLAWNIEVTIYANFSQTAGYYAAGYSATGTAGSGAMISMTGNYDGLSGRNSPITGVQIETNGQNVTGDCRLYGISST